MLNPSQRLIVTSLKCGALETKVSTIVTMYGTIPAVDKVTSVNSKTFDTREALQPMPQSSQLRTCTPPSLVRISARCWNRYAYALVTARLRPFSLSLSPPSPTL